MRRGVGWYVHHHGRGHLTRMLTIAPHLDAEVRCFSSLPEPDDLPPNCSWTVLDRDDDARPGGPEPESSDPSAGGLLHWAPVGHAGHLGRLATIVRSLADRPVDAFVVDVSMEVTLLVRLLGIRPVVIAQPGRRADAAHELGFRAASAIIAPWPRAILAPAHLEPFRARTVYTGGISRFEKRMASAAEPLRRPAREGVVLLGGQGGTAVSAAEVTAAATASGVQWRALGANPESEWSPDPWDDLRSARVVVAWAGQNSISDLAAADAASIIVPQQRPFDEQLETALAIERAGLAVVETEWPSAAEWPGLIDRAARLRPDWSRWEVEGAATRAAAVIEATARSAP